MSGKSKTRKSPAAKVVNLPQPQIVPKEKVGETVQDFIDFGGAKAVGATEQDAENWLVKATK